MDSEAQLHWLILSRLPGCSRAILRRLLDNSHNPVEILTLADGAWCAAGAGSEVLRARRRWHAERAGGEVQRAASADLELLARKQGFLLPLGHPDYPVLLAEIPDPPPLLYGLGDRQALSRPQLAIVGSRRCASVSRRIAAEFAGALVQAGFSVVSGLALGVDAAAHAGALDAGGPTVAVMATGIDRCYPARHKPLADRIQKQGLLLSEFPPGTSPRPERFPMRNRIISGLSAGVLVVEAGLQSGSLITARLALEQNREIFAVPHSIYFPGAEGCHHLLRQGAVLATAVDDIIGEVASLCGVFAPPPVPASDLSPLQALVYAELGFDPISVDQLVLSGVADVAAVVAALSELQMIGLLENRDGLYMRK